MATITADTAALTPSAEALVAHLEQFKTDMRAVEVQAETWAGDLDEFYGRPGGAPTSSHLDALLDRSGLYALHTLVATAVRGSGFAA